MRHLLALRFDLDPYGKDTKCSRSEVQPKCLSQARAGYILIEVHCSIPRCIMAGTRRRHAAAFKAKVALEAAKQAKTVAELAKTYQVHPVQISQWKKQLLDGVEDLFRDGRRREREEGEARQAELYEKIGRLNMEIEWLKKTRVANLARAECVERRSESIRGGFHA